MKRINYLNIITLCVIILFSGCSKKCRKEAEPLKVTFTGRIMETCTLPYKNKPLWFYQGQSSNWLSQPSGGEIGTGNTDNNGYFSITLPLANTEGVSLSIGNGIIYAFGLDLKDEPEHKKEIGTIQASPKVNFFVKVKASTPFNNLDTLYYFNLATPNSSGNWSKLAGPFSEYTLFYCNNYSGFGYPFEGKNTISATFKYTFNPYLINTNIIQITKEFEMCQSGYDSLIVQLQ